MRRFWFAVTLVVACVLVGCAMPTFSSSAQHEPSEDSKSEPEPLRKKPLNEYSWDELSQISAQISSAESDEAGREVARTFGLVEEDGSLTTQTKQIAVHDDKTATHIRALDVRLAGIRHDDKADGTGKAGLTFMTVGALDIRSMNDQETIDGGWSATPLRAWLNGEGILLFDQDLHDAIVPVTKLTNNVGLTADLGSVTPTEDRLWIFSVHEVCGNVSWDVDEFRQMRGYEDVDGLLNAEGSQYEVFAREGIDGTGNGSGYLSLAESTGSSPWWYRTPYPFEWTGYGDTGAQRYFYRVMDSGYPKSLGVPTDKASVVCGFCV